MHCFAWLGPGGLAPSADLRRRGWRLIDAPFLLADAEPDPACLLMMASARHREMGWLAADANAGQRRLTMVLDVRCSAERARLLALGLGDALAPHASLDEIAARAERIITRAGLIERHRGVGTLRLDLQSRDASVDGRPLGLNPREFALLWRLLDHPGELVEKTTLLREVWHLTHLPETNSLAVHASRLRAKLACFGLGELVCTAPSGGYFVATPALVSPAIRTQGRPVGARQGSRG